MIGVRLSKRLRSAAWLGLAALLVASPAPAHSRAHNSPSEAAVLPDSSVCSNLSEQIPKQYRGRYKRWQKAFLSADIGRELWLRYACAPSFRLTIVVSDRLGAGAEVTLDDYRWDGGRLSAATIVLGHHLDMGYADPNFYPVLSSLTEVTASWYAVHPDDIIAAAKIAHEFGHVDRAAKSDPERYRLQNELGQVYASHFRLNGYDADDPLLAEIAARMGGEPVVLTGQREYWAETYALRYLLVKLPPGKRRALLRSVRKSLASGYSLFYLPSLTEWQALASFE